ncbi:Microtubule-associated protein 6-like protein [Larimichthys crocea]|uniref:Uncharacterized protein n=1 Tax=Larimichthys crocea TaxID=215358 RepID=A0ACD3QK95_LARCR|nr:Microtubule-associated protein 6-like protein [Larimichthys crocea]
MALLRPSCAKTSRRGECAPSPAANPEMSTNARPQPFNNETQYQKDYKPWPIPKKNDHPWIPKPSPTATSGGPERSAGSGGKLEHAAAEAETGVEKSEIEEKTQEKESKEAIKKSVKREKSAERQKVEKTETQVQPADVSAEQRKGRAAADALNRQIKEVMSTSSSYRT